MQQTSYSTTDDAEHQARSNASIHRAGGKTISDDNDASLAMTLSEYRTILEEIEEQPIWRATADKEMDYADGNQLDTELLRKQKEIGIPPAIEDLIGPALLSIQGYESTTRTDWRVTPDGDVGGQDVADALNFRLNQAERHSKADRACSKAFRPQIGCGLGWVEVAKDSDPFKYPYRCTPVHRNEIHWDMSGGPDAEPIEWRWLRRARWLHFSRIAASFPKHRALIEACGKNGAAWWTDEALWKEGGTSTGLQNGWADGRAYTTAEDHWYNTTTKDLCLAELWYRRWVSGVVMRLRDGRIVEYDKRNSAHDLALATGFGKAERATFARVRRAYWLGPHLLHDGKTPYTHKHFPYAPFFGFREDATGVPYGYVRSMKYPQDSINSGQSKLRWGMSVVRVERTEGAVKMTDAQLRRQVARPDADIVLNAAHMATPGARFEVKRDYTLTDQHYQMLNDNRLSIERVSSITSGFIGRQGTARSGVQEQTQVEQSNQSLGFIMDNFRAGRTMIGEMLLAMQIQDIGNEEMTVVIEGDAVTADRTVVLNKTETDEQGQPYLTNDLQRTRLKVGLEEVPSTSTYRGQQLNAMSEAVKSLPPEYQAAAMPFLAALMDVPFKRELVEALRAVGVSQSPEAIEKRVREDVANELKARELDMKAAKNDADIKKIIAQAVQVGVQSAFSAMQAAAQVTMNPAVAPVADKIMQAAGYQLPNPAGVDPNLVPPDALPAAMPPGEPLEGDIGSVNENTSPAFPPIPDDGASPMTGIETPTPGDNLPPQQ
jgi:hypothetical protein